jgi:hypothetical protein
VEWTVLCPHRIHLHQSLLQVFQPKLYIIPLLVQRLLQPGVHRRLLGKRPQLQPFNMFQLLGKLEGVRHPLHRSSNRHLILFLHTIQDCRTGTGDAGRWQLIHARKNLPVSQKRLCPLQSTLSPTGCRDGVSL